MDKDCIFCKIVAKQIPAEFEYENDEVVAFLDTNPQAPVHILVIPKRHIENVSCLGLEDRNLITDLILTANQLARKKDIDKTGFRIVINTNKDAGQAVSHLHLHLLGGRAFGWPPG